MIRVVHPGSRIRILTFSYPGSRIQGSKRQPIPDPDPQHWNYVSKLSSPQIQMASWPKTLWLYAICPSVADPDPDWIPSCTDMKLLVGSRSSSKINLKASSNYANKCSSCIHIIRLLNISTFFLSTVPGSSQCCGQCCGSETFVSDPISKPDPAWN